MKSRVQTDIALLITVIILTAIFYLSPQFQSGDFIVERALDFLGFLCILKGTFLRMVARGHKKAHSQKSQSLVTTGVYSVVRNPMYLGTFMIGTGFTLIVWPWWAVPIFGVVFYLRFKRQIRKEEKFLSGMFGDQYQRYCDQTPRLFPSFQTMLHVRPRKIFDFREAWSTKEKSGLVFWPLLALALSSLQQWLVYHHVDLYLMIFVLVAAILTFMAGLALSYGLK